MILKTNIMKEKRLVLQKKPKDDRYFEWLLARARACRGGHKMAPMLTITSVCTSTYDTNKAAFDHTMGSLVSSMPILGKEGLCRFANDLLSQEEQWALDKHRMTMADIESFVVQWLYDHGIEEDCE